MIYGRIDVGSPFGFRESLNRNNSNESSRAGLSCLARAAFGESDLEGALRVTLDHLSGEGMYDKSLDNLRNLWKTSETGLLSPKPIDVVAFKMPTLLLSGDKSSDSCQLAVAKLETLLNVKRKTLSGATHAMWIDQPAECRKIVLEFLRGR